MIMEWRLADINSNALTLVSRLLNLNISDKFETILALKDEIVKIKPKATIGDLLSDKEFMSLLTKASLPTQNIFSDDKFVSELLNAQIKCPTCNYVGSLDEFAPKLEDKIKEYKNG